MLHTVCYVSEWAMQLSGCVHVLAHAQHAIDLLYSEPMEDVRHERLEAHIFHACNVLSSLEVLGCTISTALPGVVHEILSNGVSRIRDGCCGKPTFVTSPSALPSFLK